MKNIYFKTVQEAKNFIEGNRQNGLVLFAHQDKVTELSEYANENIILCSSAGEFSPQGYKEHSIVGFVYDTQIVDIVEIKTPAIYSLKSLKKGYEKVKNNPNAFLFLLCDGLSMGEESILSTLFFMKDDFKVIGASSGDYCVFNDTKIYRGNKRVNSIGMYFNMKKKTQLIKENIYHSTGKRMLITKADPLQRIVYEINGNKATVEYANALGISEQELSKSFMNHPLGRVSKDNTYIASPMKVNPDKSITFYTQILPDTFVDLLEPSNLEDSFEATINKMEFKPGFMFSVHCILRSLKFKDSNEWSILEKKLLSVTNNQTGFISYGEQFYKRHLNQTMVILAVEK